MRNHQADGNLIFYTSQSHLGAKMKKSMFDRVAFLMAGAMILLVVGCGSKKTETPEQGAAQPAQQTAQQPPAQTPAPEPAPEPVKPAVTYPDITGTWSGTLDSRSTKLTISKQDSLTFEGSIFINYREAISQKVSGSFDPEKKTLRMKDLLHSRYQGTYSAKLGDELSSMSGSFTCTADKRRSSFSLKKK
jgi:hypothetical protein